ncbi:NYN domain-containing protein [Nodosilinea sp. AN01ver1]|uniref:LabA-like NYN domain-containing protein n=1 Tax=Nodosilinea sp. AN01ver1 TaxID=3423362 RepID=UPI003D32218C
MTHAGVVPACEANRLNGIISPNTSRLRENHRRIGREQEVPRLKKDYVHSLKKQNSPRLRKDRGRVALFVDEGNLFHAALSLGVQVNYARFLNYIMEGSQFSGAFLYTAVKSDEHRQQLQSRVDLEGYQIVGRKIIRYQDGSVKANLDVEIASDLIIKAFENSYDTAVLVSGDGDFTYAVKLVKQRGRKVEVISLSSMTSRRLIAMSDHYTDLSKIKHWICN